MISANRKKQIRKASQSLENGAPARFKFIVTGFNSFGKNLENPSGLTAISLPSELTVGHHLVEIQGMLLETCCKNGWNAVRKALIRAIGGRRPEKHAAQKALSTVPSGKNTGSQPKDHVVLIMMGLAALRSTLNLERLAVNVRDYPIKDNHGHQYDGEEILPGPLALKTDFPLHELRKKLKAKGFPSVISNHAGTFVCNDIYYQSLNFQIENGAPDLVLFVHVPPARVFAETVRERGKKTRVAGKRLTKVRQIELMQESILEVIKFSVNHLVDKTAATAPFTTEVKAPVRRAARSLEKPVAKKQASSRAVKSIATRTRVPKRTG